MQSSFLKKSIKWIGVLCLCGIAAAAAACGTEEYRTISVDYLNGTSTVSRKGSENSAYQGMHLYSGDTVEVLPSSDMTLLVDSDKYLYAPENTKFSIEASGDEECGITHITLEDGSILTRIDQKLREGEEFSVMTPHSVMSVRGTVFRISVSKNEQNETVANTQVYQGAVQIDLHDSNGKPTGETVTFKAGTEGTVISNKQNGTDTVAFAKDESGNAAQKIDFSQLPKDTAIQMVLYMDEGEELCISRSELMETQNITEKEIAAKKAAQKSDVSTPANPDDTSASAFSDNTKVDSSESINADSFENANTDSSESANADSSESANTDSSESANTDSSESANTDSSESANTDSSESANADSSESANADSSESANADSSESANTDSSESNMTEDSSSAPHTDSAAGHNSTHHTKYRVTKEATCTKEGTAADYCTVCGKNVTFYTIAPKGHSYVKDTEASVPATCGTDGTVVSVCSRCHDKKTVLIPATGNHSYPMPKREEPTCNTDGYELSVCKICGYERNTVLPATGKHSNQLIKREEPTCNTDGYELSRCKQCGTDQKTILPKTGKHTPGTWETAQEATCHAPGKRVQKCTVCHTVINEEAIPADPSKHVMSQETRHFRKDDGAFTPYNGKDTEMYYGRYCTVPGCTYRARVNDTIHTVTNAQGAKKPDGSLSSGWNCVNCYTKWPPDLNPHLQ